MSSFFEKHFKKKYFDVGLDSKPKNEEAFITEIENYFLKEKLDFEFIERCEPAKIKLEDRIYVCKSAMLGRCGWHLIFNEE